MRSHLCLLEQTFKWCASNIWSVMTHLCKRKHCLAHVTTLCVSVWKLTTHIEADTVQAV